MRLKDIEHLTEALWGGWFNLPPTSVSHTYTHTDTHTYTILV